MKGELLFRDEGAALGVFGNVLVGVAYGAASGNNMKVARSAHRELSLRYPKGYAHLMVTAATAKPPSAEERAEMQALTVEFSPRMRAQALVLEGEGLVASTLRMITQAMLLAMPRSHPARAFGQVADATRWIRERCLPDGNVDIADLAAFAESLRRREADAVAVGA